jgi:hypothetical protein
MLVFGMVLNGASGCGCKVDENWVIHPPLTPNSYFIYLYTHT